MAIKFQYNKTSLTNLGKQLKVRKNALPTLKNKESALRISVLVAKEAAEDYERKVTEALSKYDYLAALWNEFEPGLVSIKDVSLRTGKVAGVCIVRESDHVMVIEEGGVIIRMAAEDWGKSTALGVSRRSVSGLSETYHGSYSERVMSELRSLRHVRAVGGAV